jgi:dipeptidyl aminopeptidase/acylaminoacyl peptidase
MEVYGSPEENPEFWASISANSFLEDLSGPLQLHHGTADGDVPVEFSQWLSAQVEAVDGSVELFTYEGDNHNISNSFETAMQRSIDFFDRYVKSVTN